MQEHTAGEIIAVIQAAKDQLRAGGLDSDEQKQVEDLGKQFIQDLNVILSPVQVGVSAPAQETEQDPEPDPWYVPDPPREESKPRARRTARGTKE
jgi:hypothetical protein